jgi:hypothetical protein
MSAVSERHIVVISLRTFTAAVLVLTALVTSAPMADRGVAKPHPLVLMRLPSALGSRDATDYVTRREMDAATNNPTAAPRSAPIAAMATTRSAPPISRADGDSVLPHAAGSFDAVVLLADCFAVSLVIHIIFHR